MTAGRELDRDDYTPNSDVAILRALVPHLETALRVGQRLAAADLREAGAKTALDQLGIGVVAVDAAASVLFANRIADALLAANDGLRLTRDDLGGDDPAALRTLHRLIAACAAGNASRVGGSPGGSVDLPRGTAGRLPLRVLVAPVQWPQRALDFGWTLASHPAALLLITDLEQQHLLRRDQLRQRFDLTPAEADVALELVKGDGRRAAAGRLGVSPATVSTHLQHIFDKTSTRRQAEIVNLILHSIPSH